MENGKSSRKSKNIKTNIERKSSNKLKIVPPVKQTLTSYKRMLQGNPLLQYQQAAQQAGIDIDQLLGSKSKTASLKEGAESAVVNFKGSLLLESKRTTREFVKPEVMPFRRTQSLKLPKSKYVLDVGVKKTTMISGNLHLANNNFKRLPISNSLSSNSKSNTTKPKSEISSKCISSNTTEQELKVNSQPKYIIPLNSKSGTTTNKEALKTQNLNNKPKQLKEETSTLRYLSSGGLQSKKDNINQNLVSAKSSNSRIKKNPDIYSQTDFHPEISPIMEESSQSTNFFFKNLSSYNRRSICQFSPHSAKKVTLFQASTPATLETQRLQEKLQKWLRLGGKQISSCRHLRYFGNDKKPTLPTQFDEENKENMEIVKEKSESGEDVKIVETPESSKVDISIHDDIPEDELPKTAKEAMIELKKLIQEDYPRAQCLGWLELIREKYRKASEEPEYWECKAALEQSIGNVGNAVEFYKTAIIQGAEVTNVDRSLDQLLQKFSLLTISPNKSKQKKFDGDKEIIVKETRTVFKSTIIQCAVHEKKLRK